MSSSDSPRFGIVASRFNEAITKSLVQGGLAALRSRGVAKSAVTVVWVPGAFELPLAALKMAQTKKYQAIVALGCILKGETSQNRHLAAATYQGLVMAGLITGVPVTCGVITAEKWKQALERSKVNGLNRGGEAAEVAWEMARTLKPMRRKGRG